MVPYDNEIKIISVFDSTGCLQPRTIMNLEEGGTTNERNNKIS